MEDKIRNLEVGVEILNVVAHQTPSHSPKTISHQDDKNLSSKGGKYT